MHIRRINLELLRAGPRHNQLLSPLTRYLGVCDEKAASIVTLPYEHADFLLRLNELRYRVADADDPGRRNLILEGIGKEMAEVLGAIDGLSGALTAAADDPGTLTHVRLVLSASELALLPFEASKVPAGARGSARNWLALQPGAPVCLTRHLRSVSTEGVVWPKRPRILYAAGPGVPFEEHKAALRDAVAPWVVAGSGDAGFKEEGRLTILENATRDGIAELCRATRYTHVHILAHGAIDESRTGQPFGVMLADRVVSGRQLASDLVHPSASGFHLPATVTMATCDSAQQAQVYTPDGSVAHELHEAGIPLVVASQFPLSVERSIPFVRDFYTAQMWGEHPLETLWEVRRTLHRSDVHDWASLVVYEAFPRDFDEQLEELRYEQAKAASNAALEALEAGVATGAVPARRGFRRAEEARDRLPSGGPYGADGVGLKASWHKRMAEIHYDLSKPKRSGPKQSKPKASKREPSRDARHLQACREHLEMARATYAEVVLKFVAPDEGLVARKASLHWVAVQELSLTAVLGRGVNGELLATGRFAAEVELERRSDAGERAWGHGSLCELALIALADEGKTPEQRFEIAEQAKAHARSIIELCTRRSFQALSTARQFHRYVHWWGDPAFAKSLKLPARASARARSRPSSGAWEGENGIIETARKVLEILVGEAALEPDWSIRQPDKSVDPAKVGRKAGRRKTRASTRASRPTRRVPEGSLAASGSGDVRLEMLPAKNGDCLWIEYGRGKRTRRLIIDCGASSAAGILEQRIAEVRRAEGKAPQFELFILTHIDADHIRGVNRFFGETEVDFKDIWFNGWPQLPKGHLDPKFLGVKQGEQYSMLLRDQKRPWNRAFTAGKGIPLPVVIPKSGELPSRELAGGLSLTLLSPGQHELQRLAKLWEKGREELDEQMRFLAGTPPPTIEDPLDLDVDALAEDRTAPDPSVANGSSIAVLAEYGSGQKKRSILLTGDAHAEVLAASIRRVLRQRRGKPKRLKVDAVKLSHHGSANALSKELLDLLDCPRYLVSTNGSQFYHPHREAIARVIKYGRVGTRKPTLYFNYSGEDNAYSRPWADPGLQEKYRFAAVYPGEGEEGVRVFL